MISFSLTISFSWTIWRKFLQEHEFTIFQNLISDKNSKILEIGGGDGMKSKFFNDLGYDIVSVDIDPWPQQYFPVQKIEKNELPFGNETFDVIFSSNVLTELNDKTLFFHELNRVLKKNGFLIHEVPSSWWSLSTNIWHYFIIASVIFKSIFKKSSSLNTVSNPIDLPSKYNSKSWLKIKKLLLHPLGDNPSFFHEIYYYKKSSWKNFFQSYKYTITCIQNHTLFFTGYGIFKNKFITIRKFLSIFFPSAYYFKLQKPFD